MTIQLTDHGTHWTVATVHGPGKRRRIARGAIRVGKSDPADLRTEIMRQANAVRKAIEALKPPPEPVV